MILFDSVDYQFFLIISFYDVKKRKSISIYTRSKEYKDTFHVDDNILFCNYCNISVEWKYKSVVDSHCSSQKHTLNVKKYEENQNKTQQLTLNSTQITSNSKKQLIEDLIEAFAIADIPLEKVNSLLPFFKKYIKNSDSIPQASKFTYQMYLTSIINVLSCFLIQNQWL
ncbi:CGG triplet repeat-binding protein 1 [Rhizophagus irregularis DAOM 181602=DAOM 197198]|nr:CGG triplet repeat-binding protein 1 [Rhizophagus irregularis DAOM 181602=DAOM 197198]